MGYEDYFIRVLNQSSEVINSLELWNFLGETSNFGVSIEHMFDRIGFARTKVGSSEPPFARTHELNFGTHFLVTAMFEQTQQFLTVGFRSNTGRRIFCFFFHLWNRINIYNFFSLFITQMIKIIRTFGWEKIFENYFESE